MLISRKEVRRYTNQMYQFIRNNNERIVFQKIKKDRGQLFLTDDGPMICLDYRDDIISTFIHEVLHYLHWNWTEKEILQMENTLMRSLSKTQVKNIMSRLLEVM